MLHAILSFFSVGNSKKGSSAIGWGGWLDTPEGKAFEELSSKVYSFLETQKYLADGENRRFIKQGNPESLDDVTKKVASMFNVTSADAMEHTLLWLSEAAEAADPDYEGTQEHFDLKDQWVEDECTRRSIHLRG